MSIKAEAWARREALGVALNLYITEWGWYDTVFVCFFHPSSILKEFIAPMGRGLRNKVEKGLGGNIEDTGALFHSDNKLRQGATEFPRNRKSMLGITSSSHILCIFTVFSSEKAR